MSERYNRRSFLGDAAKTLLAEEETPKTFAYVDPANKVMPMHLQKASSGLQPYTGTFSDAEVMHLLRRTLTGFNLSDVAFFKNMSLNDAVDYLLNIPTNPPEPPLNNYGNNPNFNDPNVVVGQTWVNAPFLGTVDGPRKASFKAWWMTRMIAGERSIREKMTLFWHNHFATESNMITDARYVYKHNALLRQHCLDNFKTLVKEVTIDPAMLDYLNGNQNTRTAPDENYARELQELFTIGKDLPIHYTEQDVREAARVLTGWRDSRNNLNSFFDANRHDTGNKQFSSFYNNTVIQGKTGTQGATELDDLLTMIFSHEEVAKYVCRKIYRFFVYYVIDEQIETNVIVPLANIFRTNNYQIKPVMEALLKSQHFFDLNNRSCVIKPPIDFTAGLFKAFNLQLPPLSNVEVHYQHALFAQQYATTLGQNLADPPSVAGWPAYHQKPQYYELWINSDSLPKRNQLCDLLIYNGFARGGFRVQIDVLAFAAQFPSVANPNNFISDLIKYLYSIDVSTNTKNNLKTAFLLSGQTEDYYWTDVWNTYLALPNDAMARSAVQTRLQALLKHILGLAEFQLS